MNYKILIIGVLIAGLSIIGASIYIGYSLRDVDVVANAYEAGLKFDATRHEKERLGWQVKVPFSLATGKQLLTVQLTDRQGVGVRDAEVVLTMNRMGDRAVKTYRCSTAGNGIYSVPVVVNESGYRQVEVQARRGTDSVSFDEVIDFVQSGGLKVPGSRITARS